MWLLYIWDDKAAKVLLLLLHHCCMLIGTDQEAGNSTHRIAYMLHQCKQMEFCVVAIVSEPSNSLGLLPGKQEGPHHTVWDLALLCWDFGHVHHL